MIRLDDLEAKAKDCTSWDWFHDCSQLAIEGDHDYSHLMDEEVRFIASMNPKTALSLIMVARAAMVINDSPNFVSLDMLKDLDEALKEIEA